MMLMRSLSPLLAPPNTYNASQFMSRHFPCGYQRYWRAAAIPGIYRGLSPPPASAPSSLLSLPALKDPVGQQGAGAAQAEDMRWQ